jgi:formyl-CoA transferase
MQEAAMWLMRGRELNWAAMPLSGVFETQDGALVMVGAFKENPLCDICRALDLADLSRKERFSTLDRQKEHRAELQKIFAERFCQGRTAHWLERLEAVDIRGAPVRTLAQALDDEQTRVNGMIVDAPPSAAGPVRLVGSPIAMSRAGLAVRQAPPRLGEHNAEILVALELDPVTLAPVGEAVA